MHPRVIPFIFASGHGTRLRPLTHELPKPLIPVQGEKTIIDLTIEELIRNDFTKVLINYSYGKEQYLELQKRFAKRITIELIDDQSVCGQGGILVRSLPKMKGYDTVLCMNGDTVIDFDINAFLAHQKAGEAALLSDNNQPVRTNLLCDDSGVVYARESGSTATDTVWFHPKKVGLSAHNYLGVACFATADLQKVSFTTPYMGFFGKEELVDQLTHHGVTAKIASAPISLFLTANTVEELVRLQAALQ